MTRKAFRAVGSSDGRIITPVFAQGSVAVGRASTWTVIRKLPTGVEEKVVTDNEDVNGGVPLDGETEQVAPGGHPERPSETASAEDPRTVTVDEAVPPGWMWTALGSAETANPADGVFVRVNESITPLELSTNSYRMIVGETWNQPKPLAGGVTRHAATQALVRHVPVPDAPPVPTIR